MNFVKWFRSEPHRDKYEADHPAFLAAREAWDASKKDCSISAVPSGWMIVPVEATDEMVDAAQDRIDDLYRVDAVRCWDAMISAVPRQGEQE